jgi:putative transposase
MANTYSSLFYHFVFSTKNRQNLIRREIELRVWAYIAGVAKHHGVTPVQIGGIENHIHALIMSKPVFAPSEIAKWLKGDSSKWIHEEFPELRSFSWQDGFGVFSVSTSMVPNVVNYITRQREHHHKHSFEQEYERMMKLHEIEYSVEYLFG